jgi:preprotein translocase SecE subunit
MVSKLKNLWLIRYLRESYIELRKVVWPTQEIVRKHTLLVIGMSLFIAIYFAVADYLLNLGLEALI